MDTLGHADVLACVVHGDIGQMESVDLGSITSQGLHKGEDTLSFLNIKNMTAELLLNAVEEFLLLGP